MGLLSVAAAGLAWRAIRLKHRLEWSERDRRRGAGRLDPRVAGVCAPREPSHILSGSLPVEGRGGRGVRSAGGCPGAGGGLGGGAGGGGGGGESGRSMLQVAAAEGVL